MTTEWFEDEEFWRDTHAAIFTPERIKQAAEEVDQVVALLGLTSGRSILDMGCGIGRHSIELAKRGFVVTGVDRSEFLLGEARRRAAAEGVSAEWVHEDMCRFRRDGAFDVAVSLLTSFGYFDDPADDWRTIENLLASLRPGGQLIIDLMPKEVLAKIFRPRDWREEAGGLIVLEARELSEDWGRLCMRWIMLDGPRRRERAFKLRLYSAAELSAMLRQAGAGDIRCYGSLAGSPYDQEAQRLVVVGRRPPA